MKRMSEKVKTIISTVIPAWFSVILLGICAAVGGSLLKQHHAALERLNQTQTDVAVLKSTTEGVKNDVTRVADVTKQLEQLSRILESRIVRLESTRP